MSGIINATNLEVDNIKNTSGTAYNFIKQIEQTVLTTATLYTSSSAPIGTPVDTGISVTIAPLSSSSKILVMWNATVGHNVDTGHGYLFLRRGSSTNILVGTNTGSRTGATHVINNLQPGEMHSVSGQYLDSPNTTSETTYALYIATTSSDGTAINRSYRDNNATNYDGRGTSSITVMEVAG